MDVGSDESDIRRGFIAERRNLLAVSVLLFFIQASGIAIEKVNFLGNEARISQPFWLNFGLWIFWLYFLLRFYQYFRDIPDKGLAATHQAKLDQLIRAKAEEHLERILDRDLEKDFPEYKFQRPVVFVDRVIKDQGDPIRLKVEARLAFTLPAEVEMRNITKKVELTQKQLEWRELRAWLYVGISTRLVTEYLLPFAVALLPIIPVLYAL